MDSYPAVTTSDEIMELQQNVCYMTTKGAKRQEYKLFANNTLNIISYICSLSFFHHCDRMHSLTHGHTSGPAEHALTKEEHIVNYEQIAIQQNASYVTSSNKNSKLPKYACLTTFCIC